MASTSRLTYVCAASWGNMCYTWLEKYVDRFFFYTCLRPISLDANNVKPFSVIESQHESPPTFQAVDGLTLLFVCTKQLKY